MAVDIPSLLTGTVLGVLLVVALIVALMMFLFGDFRKKLVKVMLKHYSKWSLFVILAISIIELADLTQAIAGFGLAPVGMVAVIVTQLLTMDWKVLKSGEGAKITARILKTLLLGFIAGLVIAAPTAILGLVMSALGLTGNIKPKGKN